ncbi:unnamed protein product [Rhizophagus irregularis]|uniref:Protein kinase domain-containing protein n=1 Tax=Rhizophagus irregularis TaxID=588596 RepID=A0A916EHE6_9GLOM|nr:unnamed protein product [Rhizophagus irregularis]
MTTSSDNKINDNKWDRWIENGIASDYINYHDFDEFQNIKRIGTGGFGEVYRANWESSNTVVALKSLKNDDCCMKEIANEITMMHKVNFHMNIVQFYGITKRKNNNRDSVDSDYLFVLEYADSGTLRDYLENNFNKLNWNDKLQFAIQIADAVSCIHRKNIVHRDLHSKNILVHKNIIKLADFGLSRRAEVSTSTNNIMGVLPYIDPHHFKNQTKNDNKNLPSKKSDVYSVGVLLWEISSGQKPFGSNDASFLLYDIINGKRETPISDTPVDYVNIYTSCWQDNPDDRPDMRKVLSELMLVNINEKLVKTWENTTASDNYSSNDYTSIKSLLHNSLSCLLQLGNEGITTKTTDVQSRSSKNELLRSFLKDHKESLKL